MKHKKRKYQNRKEIILAIYNELHNDFYSYIKIRDLARKLGLHRNTVVNYLNLIKRLGLFNKPICEWHDEDEQYKQTD